MFGFTSPLPRLAAAGIAAVLCGTALGGMAHAQVAPPFPTLLQESENAPRRIAIDADVDRAEGLAQQAGARPNPTVSLLSENLLGSSPYRGFGGTETTLQYNQPFELGGKRGARIAAGRANVDVARARALDARLSYAHDLALAYAAVEIAQERIELAEDEIEEATADLRMAKALVDAGKEAALRQLQAESALNALRADLDLARANHSAALARLSALAGAPQLFTGISGSVLSLFDTPWAIGPVDPARSSLYRIAVAERDASGLRLDVERRRPIPDVTASLGVRRLERDGATALVAGISVPLPLFDRNRGNIAAASAEVRGSEARLEAARREAEAELRGAIGQVEALEARVSASQVSYMTAQQTYRLARLAYESGKAPLSELLTARHGLGAARGVLLDATSARFNAYATLARLTGRTITGDLIQ